MAKKLWSAPSLPILLGIGVVAAAILLSKKKAEERLPSPGLNPSVDYLRSPAGTLERYMAANTPKYFA